MGDIVYVYQRPARSFKFPCAWDTCTPQGLCDIRPSTATRQQYTFPLHGEFEISNIATLSETGTNTERISLYSKGMSHIEGGWPLAVDQTDIDAKLKFTKRIEREEACGIAFRTLVQTSLPVLRQNAALDIYEVYFDSVGSAQGPQVLSSEGPTSSTGSSNGVATDADTVLIPVAKYSDSLRPQGTAVRSASKIALGGGDFSKLATAYTASSFDAERSGAVYDLNDYTTCYAALRAEAQLQCVCFHGKDVHLLAAGLKNGAVAFWDTRHCDRPVAVSHAESSHTDSVTDVKWMLAKHGEILSVALDGKCLVWDVRSMSKPVDAETIHLQPKSTTQNNTSGVLRGLCLDYEPMIGAHKFLAGTTDGSVLLCNRRGRTASDKINASFNAHYGPVFAIHRHPANPRTFLTVGDWSVKVWTDECRKELFSTPYRPAYLTCVRWHSQRASVFFAGRADGQVEIWDVLVQRDAPLYCIPVSAEKDCINSVLPHPMAPLLFVADSHGDVSLWRQKPRLLEPLKDEKANVQQWVDREAARDKAAASWAREARARHQRNSTPAQLTSIRSELLEEGAAEIVTRQYLQAVEADVHNRDEELQALEAEAHNVLGFVHEQLDSIVF